MVIGLIWESRKPADYFTDDILTIQQLLDSQHLKKVYSPASEQIVRNPSYYDLLSEANKRQTVANQSKGAELRFALKRGANPNDYVDQQHIHDHSFSGLNDD